MKLNAQICSKIEVLLIKEITSIMVTIKKILYTWKAGLFWCILSLECMCIWMLLLEIVSCKQRQIRECLSLVIFNATLQGRITNIHW